MTSPLAFAPGSSPLHRAGPAIGILFLGSLALAAFLFASPIVVASVGIAALWVGLLAGARRALGAAVRIALPLMAVMVAVNALVSHRGETVLVRGWDVPVLGSTDVTLESIAAGAAIGLRIVVVILVFAVYSACVDPDRVLRGLRPVARRSALTAALVARMVPLAAADAARLREAAALRGPNAAPVGRAALARRLVAGSLDRAVDAAASMELRGHSLPVRTARRRTRSLDDGPMLASGALIAGAAIAAKLGAAGGFETYPRLEMAADPQTVALALALPLAAVLPFGWRRVRRVWPKRSDRPGHGPRGLVTARPLPGERGPERA